MSILVMPVGAMPSWEDMVCADYVNGKIDVDQLEDEIALILDGGLPQRLFGGLPAPRDLANVEMR